MLRLLAGRVVVSIDNARLYRRVVQQNRITRTLAQLSQGFSSILQLDELLAKIAKAMRTLINYDAFSILLVDVENQCLRHRFSERYDRSRPRAYTAADSHPAGHADTCRR